MHASKKEHLKTKTGSPAELSGDEGYRQHIGGDGKLSSSTLFVSDCVQPTDKVKNQINVSQIYSGKVSDYVFLASEPFFSGMRRGSDIEINSDLHTVNQTNVFGHVNSRLFIF